MYFVEDEVLAVELLNRFDKCGYAASILDYHIASIIESQSTEKQDFPRLFLAESMLLKLAAFKDVTDGILYCQPLIYTVDSQVIMVVRSVVSQNIIIPSKRCSTLSFSKE